MEDQDVVITCYQDEICRSRALPSFLDTNSAEYVVIKFLYSDVEKHPKDYFRTNISHQKCLFKGSYANGLTRRASFLAKVGCMVPTSTVHVSLFNAEVTKIVTSLLRYFYFSLAWEILLHSNRYYHYWNRWGDSGPCKPYCLRWAHGHPWLGWSLSKLAHNLSNAAFLFLLAFLIGSLASRIPGWSLELGPRWYKPDVQLMSNVDPISHCSIWVLNKG